MQTIWNRVAQIQTACRCSRCTNAISGASRRATVAATKRTPKYVTSSTLWYSGVFAVAATYDARLKRKRRDQWDRLIAEAKDDLQEVEATITQRTEKATRHQVSRAPASRSTHEEEDGAEPLSYDGDVIEMEQELLDNLDTNLPQTPPSGFVNPLHTADTGGPFYPHRVAPQSIYARASRKEAHNMTLWSAKKMETVELCIDLLQINAFAEVQQRGYSLEEVSAYIPTEYSQYYAFDLDVLGNMFNNKVANLKRVTTEPGFQADTYKRIMNDIPLCSFHQDGSGEFHRTIQELNRCLQELFRRRFEGKLSAVELLVKVWHNFYLSPAPPNVDTFNILITGFARVREPDQVRNVISALRLAKIRPNEVTLASILRFFTAVNDGWSFRLWYGYIRGWYGGLTLARPDIHINPKIMEHMVDLRDGEPFGKVYQLPQPSPIIFGAIIRGILKFSGFDAALKICKDMARTGWGLHMSGLSPLLQDCARRADWASGLAVWERINSLQWNSGRRVDGKWCQDVIHLQTYAAMLRLCNSCGKEKVFQDVFDQASKEHRMDHQALAGLLKRALDEEPIFSYSDTAEADINKESSAVEAGRQSRDAVPKVDDSKPMSSRSDNDQSDDEYPDQTDTNDTGDSYARESSSHGEYSTKLPPAKHRPTSVSAPSHRTVPSRPHTSTAGDVSESTETDPKHHVSFRMRRAYVESLYQKPDILLRWRYSKSGRLEDDVGPRPLADPMNYQDYVWTSDEQPDHIIQ